MIHPHNSDGLNHSTMSRQPQLPPRCPFQKKSSSHDAPSSAQCKDIQLFPRHNKSVSQSSILEEQPVWLDELLSDSDSTSKGKLLRRASSDPVTLLHGLAEMPVLENLKSYNNPDSNDTCGGLESACVYGPNSPRSKEKLSIPDNIVSALSNYSFQSPMQYADGIHFASGVPQYDTVQDASHSATEVNSYVQPGKRNCGQRSRVRKIQYIAELERTVHIYQNLETELSVRVASLLHQRASLSLENRELKQKLFRLQQEKLIVDGQHQSLRKEVERLKHSLASSQDSKMKRHYRSSSASEAVSSEAVWQMLEMRKLDIN